MKRAVWSMLLSAALVASAFTTVAYADPPEMPAEPNIVDDQGDAETGSSQGDLWHAWFAEDGDKILFHFNNAAPPPPAPYGTEWRIYASPDEEGTECLQMRAQVPAGSYVGEPIARIFDACNGGTNWFNDFVGEGEVEYGEMGDGSGYITATFDKSVTPYTTDGATITAPRAQAHFLMGAQEGGFYAPLVDDTEVGTDYTVGGSGEEVSDEGTDTPKKKKGSKKKGKGKKKGSGKNKKKVETCAAYEPGELGAEAETTVVTDEATEEAPLEVPIDTSAGLGFTSTDPGGDTGPTSHAYHNIQVDPEAESTGLFARVEYSAAFDYDIFLRLADGTAVAYEADFNPAPVGAGGTEGGHAEQGAGQIDGFEANDCDGFTMDIASAITPGGEVTMKLWLGEPGGGEEGGARAAVGLMQRTLA